MTVQQNLELIQVLSSKVKDLILLRKIFIFLADYNLQQFPFITPVPIIINGKENGQLFLQQFIFL